MKFMIPFLFSIMYSVVAQAGVGDFKTVALKSSDGSIKIYKTIVESYSKMTATYLLVRYEIINDREEEHSSYRIPEQMLWTREKVKKLMSKCENPLWVKVGERDIKACEVAIANDPSDSDGDGDFEIEIGFYGDVPIDGDLGGPYLPPTDYQVIDFGWNE